MKMILALAATSLLALSVPAFAQEAGAPGAVGTGGSLTGSNPGTGYGWNGPIGDSINPGPGPSARRPSSPGNAGIYEGRAAAPDYYGDRGYNGNRGYYGNRNYNGGWGYHGGYVQDYGQGYNPNRAW